MSSKKTPPVSLRHALLSMPQGRPRRDSIVQALLLNLHTKQLAPQTLAPTRFAINRRYCIQLHHDRDLQLLIRRNILVRLRERAGHSHITYLQLAPTFQPSTPTDSPPR